MKHATVQARVENERSERSVMVKNTREKLRRNSCRSAAKMAEEAGISQTSMRRILKEDLRTLQKRRELSTTHERMRLD